jgi:hypothetical protein
MAVFTTTKEPSPPTPYSITVTSTTLNGTSISGYLVDLRVGGYAIQSGFTPVTFTSLEPGLQYQIVAFWADNYYFRHFSDGDMNRYELLTLQLDRFHHGVVRCGLRVCASFAGGHLEHNRGIPQWDADRHNFQQHRLHPAHSGMWLTVTPPDATIPYTGTFTGRESPSVRPFQGVQLYSYHDPLIR